MLGGAKITFCDSSTTNGWVTEHERKEEIIFDHFSNALGRGARREKDPAGTT